MAMKSLHKYTVQEARNRTYDVFTVTPTLDATETTYGAPVYSLNVFSNSLTTSYGFIFYFQ